MIVKDALKIAWQRAWSDLPPVGCLRSLVALSGYFFKGLWGWEYSEVCRHNPHPCKKLRCHGECGLRVPCPWTGCPGAMVHSSHMGCKGWGQLQAGPWISASIGITYFCLFVGDVSCWSPSCQKVLLMMWASGTKRAFMVDMFNWMWSLLTSSQEISILHLSMKEKGVILDCWNAISTIITVLNNHKK